MEPIGFAVGVIGLAGLYSICVQCIDQIDSGGDLGKDSQRLLAMLRTDKYLLEEWGELAGVNVDGSFKSGKCHKSLSTERGRSIIYNILGNIESILNDRNTLCKKYGLVTIKSSGTLGNMVTVIENTAASTQTKATISKRFMWAVKDKKKFRSLVSDLGGFIEKLYFITSLGDDNGGQAVVDLAKELNELKLDVKDEVRESTEKMMEQWKIQHEIKLFIDGESRQQILQWLKSVSTEAEYDEAIRERYPGTCLWIFEKDFFKDWHGGAGVQNVLWIHGGPGMGKTFLSASIVEFLQKRSSLPVAYFFCRNEDISKSETLSIVRSWIFQLASQQTNAIQFVKSMKEGDLTETRLWQVFSKVLDSMPGCCYLVLDGVDECRDYNPNSHARRSGAIKKFFQNLLQSIEKTKTTVKALLVSRDEAVIRSGLTILTTSQATTPWQTAGLSRIVNEHAILPEDTVQDIQSCARGIVDSVHIESKDTRERLAKQLSTSCEGMFLWVRLEGERFEEGMDSKDLEEIIASMPRGLGHSYQRNLERISRLEKILRDQAISILRWILFAFEPLSVQTLLHFLAVKEDGSVPDEVSYPIDDDRIRVKILRICGSLVETRGSSASPEKKTIHFTHFSVKEFLISDQNLHDHPTLADFFYTVPELSHSILTRNCLLYLLSYPLSIPQHLRVRCQTPPSSPLPQPSSPILKNCLLDYPTDQWVEHLKLSPKEHSSQCMDLQRRLFKASPEFWLLHRNRMDSCFGVDKRTAFKVACDFGLVDICKEMVMIPDIDINEIGSNGNTALHSVVEYGHLEIAELLLSLPGINANLQNKYGVTALWYAIASEHVPLLKLLLGNATVNVGSDNYTQFYCEFWITEEVPIEVLDLFLKRRVFRVRETDVDGNTILQIAVLYSYCGTEYDFIPLQKSMVERLLERDDIDINKEINEGFPLLLLAVVFWKPLTIMQLLEKGQLNVNTRDWDQCTPLHRVIQHNMYWVMGKVASLIQYHDKEDPSYLSEYLEGRKPGQHEVIQRFLGRKDLQVNARDKDGQTPLHWAAALDDTECKPSGAQIIKLLLTRDDANVNLQDIKGRTPLCVAVQSLCIGSVRELLTRDDIDVNLQNHNGSTPLSLAILLMDYETIQELLARDDIDVNTQDNMRRTPLYLAVALSDDETIKRLLTRGKINVNPEDHKERTPLHVAAKLKNYKVIQQLLARKCTNINLQDHMGRTPLFVAVQRADIEAIQRLLSRQDLDVTIPDNTGTTPLMVATKLHQQQICQWLLSRGFIGMDLSQSEYPTQESTEQTSHLSPPRRFLKRGSSERDNTTIDILPRSKSPRR